MSNKKEWKDLTPREKKAGSVIAGIVILLLLVIVGSVVSSNNANNQRQVELAKKVQKVVDGLGVDEKKSLASTSAAGYMGEIVNVEADSKDSVKVNVSTYFKEPGDENDGGKNIARKIFFAICRDVPELQSLYVKSISSGLESRSVYRSKACE